MSDYCYDGHLDTILSLLSSIDETLTELAVEPKKILPKCRDMTFEQALPYFKQNVRIRRKGWSEGDHWIALHDMQVELDTTDLLAKDWEIK